MSTVGILCVMFSVNNLRLTKADFSREREKESERQRESDRDGDRERQTDRQTELVLVYRSITNLNSYYRSSISESEQKSNENERPVRYITQRGSNCPEWSTFRTLSRHNDTCVHRVLSLTEKLCCVLFVLTSKSETRATTPEFYCCPGPVFRKHLK